MYSEVGSMKTGDYMIHVSILFWLSLVLNYLTLLNLIRCTSWPAKISNAKTGKFFFSFENPIYEVFLVWSEISDQYSRNVPILIRLNFTHF